MKIRIIATILMFCCITCHVRNVAAESPRADVIIGEETIGTTPPGKGVLDSPLGVAFDGVGTMYIAELAGGRVLKMGSDGVASRIAGDGTRSYSGDGGPAIDATFNGLHNVAATPDGDLYLSDAWNHCVRKIDGKSGLITTIAGTGEAGFSGDGGPATKATFDYLMCVTLNDTCDKLYVADLKNLRIRMIDLKSGLVTTVAGNGQKGIPQDGEPAIASPLVDPRAVATDSNQNLYILERGGHALRVVRADGTIETLAGDGEKGLQDGSRLKSRLASPKHLAIDDQDRVLIADDLNRAIRRFDPETGLMSTILGQGVSVPQRNLLHPHGVCVHRDGSVFVVDTGHHRILRWVGE